MQTDEERRAKRDAADFKRSRYRWIDPEIKPVVVELNNRGYLTSESCAGHSKSRHPGYRRGIIWIWAIYDSPNVMKILKKHGLKNIRRRGITSEHIEYRFSPVGKPFSSSFG